MNKSYLKVTSYLSVTSVTRRFPAQQEVRSERLKELEDRAERIKEMAPKKDSASTISSVKKGNISVAYSAVHRDVTY